MIQKITGFLMILGLLAAGSATAGSTAAGSVSAGRDAIGDRRLGGPPQAPARPLVERSIQAAPPVEAHTLFLPAIQTPHTWVNTTSRAESRYQFQVYYLTTGNVDIGWQGDLGSCNAGTTSGNYREAILRRINYFRSMAGVPDIKGLDPVYNQKAQAAALMMSVNRDLNHHPPANWVCYTAAGSEAAGRSNLGFGFSGTGVISDGYMSDFGADNFPVGHRRWILYPQTQWMGTGDIPFSDGYSSANALWVIDLAHMDRPRPTTRDLFVAWPPPGYVPFQVVYPRWSFAWPGANFDQATVTMTHAGQGIPVAVRPVVYGYGENTLVWEPGAPLNNAPAADTRYTVVVDNVLIDGQARRFSYEVIVFDPAQ